MPKSSVATLVYDEKQGFAYRTIKKNEFQIQTKSNFFKNNQGITDALEFVDTDILSNEINFTSRKLITNFENGVSNKRIVGQADYLKQLANFGTIQLEVPGVQVEFPMREKSYNQQNNRITEQSDFQLDEQDKRIQVQQILKQNMRNAADSIIDQKQNSIQAQTGRDSTVMSQQEKDNYQQSEAAIKQQEAIQRMVDKTDNKIKQFDQDQKNLEGQIKDFDPNDLTEDSTDNMDVQKRNRIRQRELNRRAKEKEKYLIRNQGKPALSKEQAQQKIQFYMLETEKRALKRIFESEKKQQLKEDPQNLKEQIDRQSNQSNDPVHNQYEHQSGTIHIRDLNDQDYNFKLRQNVEDLDTQSKADTLHSFYSAGIDKQNILLQKVISSNQTPLFNQSQAHSKINTNARQTHTKLHASTKDSTIEDGKPEEEEEQHLEDEKPVISIINNMDRIQNLQEVTQRVKEEQECLEICGQQFITQINDLLQEWIANDNHNQTQNKTFNTLNAMEILLFDQNRQDDTQIPLKLLNDFAHIITKQHAFFQKVREGVSKYSDQTIADDKINYFNQCMKNQVQCFPYLNKVYKKTFMLKDRVLNIGVALAIKSVLAVLPNLLNHIILDSNSMSGKELTPILQGCLMQSGRFKTFTVQDNEIDENCVDLIIQLLKRRLPDHLDSLNLYYCKIQWNFTLKLLQNLVQSKLQRLSLVKAGINEFSVQYLIEIVQNHKRLVYLDISWNALNIKLMRKLLESFSTNRRLQVVNFSWNNISDHKVSEKEQYQIVEFLSKAIKHNKKLLHLDLTCTGLTPLIIQEIGSSLRRAGSLLAIHLSGNPGLTQQNKEYLPIRIKCRPNEDMARYARIQSTVSELTKNIKSQIKQGVVWKMKKNIEFKKKKFEPIGKLEKFVFQRMLGFRTQQPGSGQWYESSLRAVPLNKHYMNDCWICGKYIYSILLWSRGRAYILNPILPASDVQQICYQIDLVDQEQSETKGNQINDQNKEPGIGFENGNLPYDELLDKTPYLAGSFTGWRYKKMRPLHEWTKELDQQIEDPIDVGKAKGYIRRKVQSIEDLTEKESVMYKIVESEIRKKYRVEWATYFSKYLEYKQPYIINGSQFSNINDEDDFINKSQYYGNGTDYDFERIQIDSESDDQNFNANVASTKNNKQENKKAEEKVEQLPQVPDESKWDIVYVLPFFAKPGRHQYMIKFKNKHESNQHRLINKKHKLQLEFDSYNNNQKSSQKVSKTMLSKVVKREFVFHTSVFSKWIKETQQKVKEQVESDAQLWKISKFIKQKPEENNEVQACVAILHKYSDFLKECFINLIAISSYPAITQLDVAGFMQKCQVIEGGIQMKDIDRFFISSNFSQPENPKFQIIGNALVRFEFWEFLVRMSNFKYRETGQVKTYSEAFEKLIKERLIPNAQLEPWQGFRDNELWTIDVNDILEANLENLKKIYSNYFSSVKKFITYDDVLSMCTKECDLDIPEKDIQQCFVMSKMAVTNEVINYKQYQIMQFVEFLEFIGRLADIKFRQGAELSTLPLVQKIDAILDELCPSFGLSKNDVNVEQQENSESDDDY